MRYSEDKIIKMVKATQAMEGLTITKDIESKARDIIRGKRSSKELIKEMQLNYKPKISAVKVLNGV